MKQFSQRAAKALAAYKSSGLVLPDDKLFWQITGRYQQEAKDDKSKEAKALRQVGRKACRDVQVPERSQGLQGDASTAQASGKEGAQLMSRKNCCKHPERGRSHYPERLTKRGLNKTPEMESLAQLRSRQAARVRDTGVPYAGGPKAKSKARLAA